MQEVKDTKQATVRIGYDGKVHKHYHGPGAAERYKNEVRMLKFLEEKGCDFVPKLLENHDDELYIVTTNCGRIVAKMRPERLKALYEELESFGVVHDDPFLRNVTYNDRTGRFNIIDFEFATIPETGEGLTLKDVQKKQDDK